VLIAVVVGATVVMRTKPRFPVQKPRRALLWVALIAFEWGAYETLVATQGSMSFDNKLDDARAVAMHLAKLDAGNEQNGNHPTLLSTDLLVADSLPSSAPQSILWAPHMLVFSGASNSESKERFYQYLYYTGVTPERLRDILRNERRYGFAVGLFGFERTIRGLSQNPKPITQEDLEAEIKHYSDYASSFSSEQAGKVRISYLVSPVEETPDFSRLDRWYKRDGGERVGNFMLYRTQLRSQSTESGETRLVYPRG